MRIRKAAPLLAAIATASCNRPQKSCKFENNGATYCIEWRGYTAAELTTMTCFGRMEDHRSCPRENAVGYCVVKDARHENHDFFYDRSTSEAKLRADCSPYEFVSLR